MILRKILVLFLFVALCLTVFTSCGGASVDQDNKVINEEKSEFAKYAELEWIKVGVLAGWTDTVDASQQTIKIIDDDGDREIIFSYSISATRDEMTERKKGEVSGTPTESKVTYAGIEFNKLTTESAGLTYVLLLGAKGQSDSLEIDLNCPIDADIEKMLNSIELRE